MDTKAYTRNEIAKRSRRRQQIKKEEAKKAGVIKKDIWLSKAQYDAIAKSGENLDLFINKALSAVLSKMKLNVDNSFPLDEIEENTIIQQKRVGL